MVIYSPVIGMVILFLNESVGWLLFCSNIFLLMKFLIKLFFPAYLSPKIKMLKILVSLVAVFGLSLGVSVF